MVFILNPKHYTMAKKTTKSKEEKALIKAIKGGDKDKASEALSAFSALDTSTDEQSNKYYEQIDALGEETPEIPSAKVEVKGTKKPLVTDAAPAEKVNLALLTVDELKAIAEENGVFYNVNSKERGLINALMKHGSSKWVKIPDPVETPATEPRVERRGLRTKAKSKSRAEIEKMFDQLQEACIDLQAETKRQTGGDASFARRMVKALRLMKRRVIR